MERKNHKQQNMNKQYIAQMYACDFFCKTVKNILMFSLASFNNKRSILLLPIIKFFFIMLLLSLAAVNCSGFQEIL